MVAEVTLNDPAQKDGGNIDPAEADKGAAFKQLADFLGKKNERGQGLSMTTPVFSKSKQGVMQFYIGEGYQVRSTKKHLRVFRQAAVVSGKHTAYSALGFQLDSVMMLMLHHLSGLNRMPNIWQTLRALLWVTQGCSVALLPLICH